MSISSRPSNNCEYGRRHTPYCELCSYFIFHINFTYHLSGYLIFHINVKCCRQEHTNFLVIQYCLLPWTANLCNISNCVQDKVWVIIQHTVCREYVSVLNIKIHSILSKIASAQRIHFAACKLRFDRCTSAWLPPLAAVSSWLRVSSC